MTKMSLDVGCSVNLRGDINVDTEIPEVRWSNDKAFIRADGQHLPFRNEVFEYTTSFHLIEHIKNPYLLLEELIRVTKTKVTIKCPYRFSLIAKSPQHRHYFNKNWFRNVLLGKKLLFVFG